MKSRTTRSFWRCFDALAPEIREQAVKAYRLWRTAPFHPGLRFKCLSERDGLYSVRIGIHYRALGYRDHAENETLLVWFWIGGHADYDRMIAAL